MIEWLGGHLAASHDQSTTGTQHLLYLILHQEGLQAFEINRRASEGLLTVDEDQIRDYF